jgi:hypothetical protein
MHFVSNVLISSTPLALLLDLREASIKLKSELKEETAAARINCLGGLEKRVTKLQLMYIRT